MTTILKDEELDAAFVSGLNRADIAAVPAAASAVVTVRLLPEAWMWTWEICGPGGEVTDSGWTSEWAAYGTAEEAYAAGRQRLTDRAAAAGRGT